jgi:hypothetical protein
LRTSFRGYVLRVDKISTIGIEILAADKISGDAFDCDQFGVAGVQIADNEVRADNAVVPHIRFCFIREGILDLLCRFLDDDFHSSSMLPLKSLFVMRSLSVSTAYPIYIPAVVTNHAVVGDRL